MGKMHIPEIIYLEQCGFRSADLQEGAGEGQATKTIRIIQPCWSYWPAQAKPIWLSYSAQAQPNWVFSPAVLKQVIIKKESHLFVYYCTVHCKQLLIHVFLKKTSQASIPNIN
jgi:hypothetical protein